MKPVKTRREFLAEVGRGTLVATLGTGLATDLEMASAADQVPTGRLTFGNLEPLVALMQETPVAQLISKLSLKQREGVDLRTLIQASALANVRTFGGEDYIGFHTMMALAPAWHMSRELPADRAALPAYKVMYRNTARINEFGGPMAEKLKAIPARGSESAERPTGEQLRELVRGKDMARADACLAAIGSDQAHAEDAFNAALYAVGDNTEVHRTVLPYRSWDLLDVIGKDYAQVLLRQSVHYCVKSEREYRHTAEMDRPRQVLPKLMDQYKLAGRPAGTRTVDDAWVAALCDTFFTSTPEQAADAAAAALADGVDPKAVGEAISLAANQLVLRDQGRREREVQPGKPVGSVHGDSIGLHACDSANAWRNMSRVSNARNQVACLILGAFQVSEDRTNRGGDFQTWKPRPHSEELAKVTTSDPTILLKELETAIRANNQSQACAVAGRFAQLGHDARPLFNLFLKYAISEDGALHAEKFYRTVSEDFAASRPAFRWRYLIALARVTASAYGRPANGFHEACERLGVTV